MDLWIWAQVLYVPVFLVALVAWCRQEGESLAWGATVATVFIGLSVALNVAFL